MYDVTIGYEIGESVLEKSGRIFEVTKISLEISGSSIEEYDEFNLILEGIDLLDIQNYSPQVIEMDGLRKPTDEQLEEYLERGACDMLTSESEEIVKEFEELNKINSIDKMLDEINQHRKVIGEKGDPKGVYKRKINRLNKKISELCSQVD